MNPLWIAALRRHWTLVGAVCLFLVFSAVHATVFRPLATRWRQATRQATELGAPLDPGTVPTLVPPRVSEVLTGNSLNAAVAEEQGTSGALTAGLLSELTNLADHVGLTVQATEQGAVTQLSGSVQVRAHLKLRGRYADFVALLGELAGHGSLLIVDRFAIGGSGSPLGFDLYVSQILLKRTGAGS